MMPRRQRKTALFSLIVLGALLGVELWGVGAVSTPGPEQGSSQVYTVAQVLRRITRDPHAWVGRLVNVEAHAVEMVERLTTTPDLVLEIGPPFWLPDTDQTVHLGLLSGVKRASSPILWARLRLTNDPLSRLRGTLRQWIPWLSRFIAPPRQRLLPQHDVIYRLRLLRVPTAQCHGADCDVAEFDSSSLR